MTFQLGQNHKFTVVALRGANVAPEALTPDICLDDGSWILGHPPVVVDETWQKWLGTLQAGALSESNLVIIATAPAACPFVLDGENQALERRCLNILIALGLTGLCFDGPGIILNGCQLDEHAIEPTQVRQVHDTACYRRLSHTIPPSLTQQDLVAADRLADSIHILLQRNGHRLLKGLSAAHKGLEGRYGDERLHQFVRAVEAIMKPDAGSTQRQFVHRAQLFVGRSLHSKTIARQIYRLRSCVEHMNEYTSELTDITQNKDAAEKLAQRRSLQAGLLASHVYRHILNNSELFTLFLDETRIQEFWAKPDHEQDEIWATNSIDLETAADEILDPFGVHGINKNPRRP